MSPSAASAAALIVLSVTASLGGCAGVLGTRPLDMSAGEHDGAARRARDQGKAKLAAEHADAARTLRSAEDRACERVAPRDIAPGVSGLEVVRVTKLERPLRFEEVAEGAAVVIAAQGRSFDAIDRMMKCRAARAAVTRDALDPLAVRGTTLRVYRDDGDAVVVQLRSRDPDRAAEIARRVAAAVGPDAGDTGATEKTDPQGIARPRDDGSHDPRTHVAEPSSPAPRGLAPIDGSTGVSRRP